MNPADIARQRPPTHVARLRLHVALLAWSTILLMIFCGCAAVQTAWPSYGPEGHWQGVVVRGDYRQTVTVDLEKTNSKWGGTFRAGDLTRPLEHVTFSGDSIHFDTTEKLAFDGRIEGESMVGFLSGSVTGSLALSRDTTDPFTLTSRLEPREPVLMFGPP